MKFNSVLTTILQNVLLYDYSLDVFNSSSLSLQNYYLQTGSTYCWYQLKKYSYSKIKGLGTVLDVQHAIFIQWNFLFTLFLGLLKIAVNCKFLENYSQC
jgi:hypothetical protein